MRLFIEIGDIPRGNQVLLEGFDITKDLGGRMATCRLQMLADPSERAAVGLGKVGSAVVGQSPSPFQEIVINENLGSSPLGVYFDEATFDEAIFGGGTGGSPVGDRQFAGYVSDVRPEYLRSNPAKIKYHITCQDYTVLLDNTEVTEISYSNQTDKDIIQAVFTAYLPEVDTSLVSSLTTIETFNLEGESLRTFMEKIAELTGAEWYLDFDKRLRYYLPSSNPAPFSLTETPDYSTSFDFDRKSFDYAEDFRTPANRVKVIGGLKENETAYTATSQDLNSQAAFGKVFSRVIVDRNIASDTEAQLRAQVEVQRYAFPEKNGTVTYRRDGVNIGQLLTINSPTRGLSGDFLVRKLSMRWKNPSLTEYTAEFGDYRPDLAKTLRRLKELAKEKAPTPLAKPVQKSVYVDHFASTIEPVQIVNSLPSLPDPNYSANAVVLLTTDRKIYRRNGDAWTAVVPTTDLSGTIIETQIANDSISTPKLQALSVTSGILAANSVIAGKVAADAVTAGTIAVGAIRAIDAVFDSGAIQSADIGNAQINNAHIVSLGASKLTAGTIDASVITVTNLNASNITTGTLSGSYLDDGTVADIKIASGLSATKITTGTLDASVVSVTNLNASNITTGSMAADRIGAGTMDVGSGGLTINGTGSVTVAYNVRATDFKSKTSGNLVINSSDEFVGTNVKTGGTGATGSVQTNSLNVGGAQRIDSTGAGNLATVQCGAWANSSEYRVGTIKVVGAQGSAIGNPTGGTTVDTEARAVIVSILGAIRTHGLIAT